MPIALLILGIYLANGGGITQKVSQNLELRDGIVRIYNQNASTNNVYADIKGFWASDALLKEQYAEVTNYLNFTSEQTTSKGAKELFEMTLNSYTTSEPLFALVIAQQKNDLFIGSCGFSTPDKQQNCECFYALLPEYWGQGFATEAMTQLLDYGFHQLGIKGVIAHVNRDNLASIQVAKKLALNYQGLVEFKGIPEQGKLFSLTKENYLAR